MTTHIWQAAIWLTLMFVVFSLILQYIARKNSERGLFRVSEILEQNKALSITISKLHGQIAELNKDLERLSKENVMLRLEVEKLHTRVESLQNQIIIKE